MILPTTAGNPRPILIIAAARSGTKMLRNVLSASQDITGYPYDANYVWKLGNHHIKHDELTPEDLDQKKKEKIRHFFFKLCERDAKPRLLEKTVSNSLRIPFVRSVFPECKIIHLYRDGFDVTADAKTCWQEKATSERIQSREDRIRKLREFPFSMAWPYLVRYLQSYGKKLLLGHSHVDTWGPRYEGIDEDVRHVSLAEVCARQWSKCVLHCLDALNNLSAGFDYIHVCYENLVANPGEEMRRIVEFIDIPDKHAPIQKAEETMRTHFISSYRNLLSPEEYGKVSSIVHHTAELITGSLPRAE